MYLGLCGIIASFLIIFIIPRNALTNGVDIPKTAQIGLMIFIVSAFMTIMGAFFTSELGNTIISAFFYN